MNKRLFWACIFVLSIFFACLCTNYDYDFFARIIVGERFIENGILPFNDFVSYTPTHPWFDHEWGSGVIFYLLLKFLGAGGLIAFYSLMMFGTVVFVVKAQRLQKHSYPVSIIFTVIFMTLFSKLNFSLVRCHLFTFFFFSLFLYILEKERKVGTRLIWSIPFITIFWNNVHGGVVSGLGLILMYFLGEFLNKKSCKNYLKLICITLPLLIINPYGLSYLKFLLSATTMNRKYIAEWMSFLVKFHFFYYIIPSLFVIFGFLANLINTFKKKHFDYTKFIILSVTVLEGLLHVKLLTLSLISVCVYCYNDIYGLFLNIKKIIKPVEKSLYLAIFLVALSIPLYSPSVPRADFSKFPLYEVEFLKLNNIKGNIVTPFGLGSYVSYKLYPDNLIYMDGRYEEVYNDKEFLTLRDYELAEQNWDDIIKNYDTEILMPKKTVEVYKLLQNNPEWVHIFDGRLCGIFVKKEDVKTSYIEPEYGIDYYRKTMFNATYFGKKLKRN